MTSKSNKLHANPKKRKQRQWSEDKMADTVPPDFEALSQEEIDNFFKLYEDRAQKAAVQTTSLNQLEEEEEEEVLSTGHVEPVCAIEEKGKEKAMQVENPFASSMPPPSKKIKLEQQDRGILRVNPWLENVQNAGPHKDDQLQSETQVVDPGCGKHLTLSTNIKSTQTVTMMEFIAAKQKLFIDFLTKSVPNPEKNGWLMMLKSSTAEQWLAVLQQKLVKEYLAGRIETVMHQILKAMGLAKADLGEDNDAKWEKLKGWLVASCKLADLMTRYKAQQPFAQ